MSEFNFEDFDLGGLSDEAAFGFDPSALGDFDLKDFDLGGLGDLNLRDFDVGDFDVGDFDLGGFGDLNLGDLDLGDIGGFDLPAEFNIDPGAFSFDEIDAMLADAAGGTGGFDLDNTFSNEGGTGRTRSLGNTVGGDNDFKEFNLNEMSDEAAFGFDPSILKGEEDLPRSATWDSDTEGEVSRVPFSESSPDYKQPSDEERAAEQARYEKFLADQEVGRDPTGGLADASAQDFGASTDVDKSLSDMGDRGGKLTSQWQKTKDGRYVMIQDDGSAIGIDQDGNSFALSASQVGDRIKSGDLNTFASGYNTATGGNKTAPGGGSSVVLNNGKTGTLKTNGTVINDKGDPIGTEKDVKSVVTQDGDGKKIVVDKKVIDGTDGSDGKSGSSGKGGGSGGGGGGDSQNNMLSSLLPLLLMMLAMNKDKGGGGGGSSTVIPGLTATQRQTPYTQQQRAPGYRPGQGGITYFDQTQYAPKMASGGIARLLKGPGDGVSDSIPAVITNGMARGGQPAKVARGEYIIDARTVAALGNGSTDAGAERLDKMRKNILRDDRKAGVGKDSKAYRHLLA
jgi:hypothetical protein